MWTPLQIFVAFATGEEGQTITALGGRTVPSLESVANSGAFLDPAVLRLGRRCSSTESHTSVGRL